MAKHQHKWNVSDPQPYEAFCEGCGALYKGGGKPRKASPKSDTTAVLADIAAGMVGMGEPSNAKPDARVDVTPDGSNGEVIVTAPVVTPTWCKMAGTQIADAYVLLVKGALLRFAKREAKDPEEDNVKELGTALGDQLAIWFPDTEMTPLGKVALAAAAVTATMVVGSTPIQPPARSVGTKPQTDGVAPSEEMNYEQDAASVTGVRLPAGVL